MRKGAQTDERRMLHFECPMWLHEAVRMKAKDSAESISTVLRQAAIRYVQEKEIA